MNRRREAGDEQPPFGAGKDLIKLAPHRALAGRVAAALDVGRILQQRQHAFFAVLGEGVQIEQPVVGRRGINLEIAGVDHDAQRRVDRQRNAIHQAVRDLNGMDGERPDLEAFAGPNLAQIGVVEQTVLVQLVFDIGQREFGAPDRHIQFGKNPRQRANVVFVAVGQNDAAHPLAVLDQVGDVGNDDVHAQQFGFGEHQSGVDDDDVVAPAHGHAVHAEFAKAAERHEMEFSGGH